jgi:phosphoglycerate dehydrogenase-like enzyme
MDDQKPVVVVLCGRDRPPGMVPAGTMAEIRYAAGHELAASLPGADVLFAWDFLSDALAAAWPHADALRWVHVAGAGVDRVLFPELAASDVTVTNSRGVFDEPMAEYVLALVLCFAKDLHTTLGLQRQRRWRHRETERLQGARALVVGSGPIGRAIGRRLASAGLAVSGIGRTGRAGDPDLGDIRPFGQLHDMLGDADYVVLAAPLTPETGGMMDAAALRRMKPAARLINVGRGALVNEADLAEALAAGRIGGAALDVFADEPLPESSPLWDMPDVIVSPHMSGDVTGWREELVELFIRNLRRYREGAPLFNVVDKHRGYVSSSGETG